MMNLTELLDSLVRELKAGVEFSDVRFVHTGKLSPAEQPVESPVIACSVKSFRTEGLCGKNAVLKGKLGFTVVAASGEGSRQVTQRCIELACGIEESSMGEHITGIACLDAVYDSHLRAYRQSVMVDAELSKEGVSSGNSGEIEGLGMVFFRDFEDVTEYPRYEIKELLSGVVSRYENVTHNGKINLSVWGSIPLPTEKFDLVINELKKKYTGCVLAESRVEITSDKGVVSRYILSYEDSRVIGGDEDE